MVAFAKLGGDVVVKPLFGSEGRGIVRLTDAETAFRTFKALRMIQAILYVQRYVQHAGYDVRVMVLDGDVCGTMKRVSDLDFRTNVTQQARAVAYAATDEERQLAVAAANATGTRMAGVDIIRDATGQAMVLEVNAVPGWRALSAITGTDYADLLIQSVEKGP